MPEGTCEIPLANAGDEELRQILQTSRVIAVVGLSAKPEHPSYEVAAYLKNHGYQIIPVNPNAAEILGEKSYPDLLSIPVKVDVVDIFRKPEAVPEIVDSAIKIGAKVVWMQEGIVHNATADKARRAGLTVVMDRCMRKTHKRLFNNKP